MGGGLHFRGTGFVYGLLKGGFTFLRVLDLCKVFWREGLHFKGTGFV